MLGPFATTSRLTPIHQVSPLYCRTPPRIDVHDNDDNDDDNDNAWQRGPLWPHGMGPIRFTPCMPDCYCQFNNVWIAASARICRRDLSIDQALPVTNPREAGGHDPPPAGGLAIEVLVHLTSVMSLWTCHSSFLVTENINIRQLHQYCQNGLQMENKSQEILHHLGTQKDAKLCLKCTKIRLAAGLGPDPLGELLCTPRLPSRNQGVPTSMGPTSKGRERKGKEKGEGRERIKKGREGGLPPCITPRSATGRCIMHLNRGRILIRAKCEGEERDLPSSGRCVEYSIACLIINDRSLRHPAM